MIKEIKTSERGRFFNYVKKTIILGKKKLNVHVQQKEDSGDSCLRWESSHVQCTNNFDRKHCV